MSLITQLLDLQIPQTIRLSPNGLQVLYSTTFTFGHKAAGAEHPTSTLWLAKTGTADSATQLTSGEHNDRDPRWLPDGKTVVFVSDRAKAGESSAIYLSTVAGGEGGEVLAITPTECEREIKRFEVSPDGSTIAFLSADEKTKEQRRREEEKDDAQVWGEEWAYCRLRVVDVATKAVRTIVAGDAHVVDLAWNDAGTHVATLEVEDPDTETPFVTGTTVSVVDVASREVRKLCHFPSRISNLLWSGNDLYFLGPLEETKGNISASTVYHIPHIAVEQRDEVKYQKHSHGDSDCAITLSKAGSDVVVFVRHGMEDQIRMLGGHTLFSQKREIVAWDATFTTDSDEVVLALAQGDTNHPTEIYTTTASGGAKIQLSNHGSALISHHGDFGTCAFLSCPSADEEVTLNPLFLTPSTATKDQPQPTVVLIHGGPYSRPSESFDTFYFMWTPLLLSAGYAVLLPDYRGSSARGEPFASYARGVGRKDYGDIISCVNHATSTSLSDPDRLVIGGWSQGGLLTYLSCVRDPFKFRAAIPGAGVTDWDTLTLTSDISHIEAAMAAPDALKPWQQNSKSNISARYGSAIWEVRSAVMKYGAESIPPMLILHGEKDERVPVEQAKAMRRAMRDWGLRGEVVVFPREPHLFGERRHLEDMGRRVVRWCDRYIGSGST